MSRTKKKSVLSEATMTGATGKSHLYEATIPNVLERRPSSHPVISTLIGFRVKSRPMRAGMIRKANT